MVLGWIRWDGVVGNDLTVDFDIDLSSDVGEVMDQVDVFIVGLKVSINFDGKVFEVDTSLTEVESIFMTSDN